MNKIALFVGRFQPFHKGHLKIIQKILKQNTKIIIIIGSAEQKNNPQNPLCIKKRIELIKSELENIKINNNNYKIIPLNDINNINLWKSHLDKHTPSYDIIYTGSEKVIQCFNIENPSVISSENKKHRPIKIRKIKKRELSISGDLIRNLILENNPKWKNLVTKNTYKLLKSWNFEKNLKNINNKNDKNKPKYFQSI